MMTSILTLNLWRYYDFDVRLPNIVNVQPSFQEF